mgnify:CR=1 FL=1
MPSIEKIIANAERKCAQRGKKLTPKREKVLKALLNSKAALSPYELATLFKQQLTEPMPAMSIYRILNLLSEVGLAHKLETANKYVACSHIASDHEHRGSQFLICNDCNMVEEIDVSLEALSAVESAADAVGFSLHNQHIEVTGLCGRCNPASS